MVPAPAPDPPKLAGSMAPGSDSGSPALVIPKIYLSVQSINNAFIYLTKFLYSIFFFFSFRPFPLVRGGHSVSSFSTSFCLQCPSSSHQLPSYLLLPHLKIFSLVALFSSSQYSDFIFLALPAYFILFSKLSGGLKNNLNQLNKMSKDIPFLLLFSILWGSGSFFFKKDKETAFSFVWRISSSSVI